MGKLTPEEFNKKYLGKNLKGNQLSGAMGIGSVELPSDFGKTEYDAQAQRTDITNLNDFRAENQPLSERWRNGVSKALLNVPIRVADGLVTSTAAVFGGLGELGDAFIPGDNVHFSDFINNPISQAFDGLSKELQESMPVYRSDEYEDAGFAGKAFGDGSSAFWADTMTDAASFMGASLLGGMGVAKGLGGLTKQALKLSKAKTILGELEAAGNLGSLTNKSELIKSIVASTYGGAAESGVEARQTYQDLIAKGATEEEAQAATNISFLTNMFLTTGANFAQFGKIFSKTIDESLDASRLISEGGKLKISELSKTQKAYNMLLNNGSDIVTEGGQEASQFVTSKFLENYYTGDDETRDDFFKSMVHAVSELKSSEGIESILAGAVLGGLSTAGKKFAERGKKSPEEANLQAAVDNYNNSSLSDVFSPETKVLAEQFSRNLQADAAIKEAVRNNDELGADLIKATSFGDQVVANLRVGKFEDLIQQLTDVKDSNVEDTNELFKSESFNKFTEDEKNSLAEAAIEQAYKIKKSYEANMVKYGKVISHEDVAKMSINESILDFGKKKEQEIYNEFKPLIDIEKEILSTYKSPKEIEDLRSKNDTLTKSITAIKSDIKAKGKDYKGERDKDLELAINNSNEILKTIENSITDYEGSGQVSYKDKDNKEVVRDYNIDYKKTVVKEINKRLNNLKAAVDRNAGDITEWQKYNKLLKDYVKVQKIKEDIIDARNKYAVDPAGYFAKVNSNIDKIRDDKNLKELFTTKSQPFKNSDGFVDKDSEEDLTIEKGLYYTRLGRQIWQKDSKGQRKLENGKPILSDLVQNRRKFIEVVDTFAKVNPNTNQTEGWVKIKEGDTTKEIPVSSLNGQLNRAQYLSKEGVQSMDKMTEEEAFYYHYKDRIIQYQYRSTFSEPAKIIEGQLAYNYRGDLVVRYFEENSNFPRYTHPLFDKDGIPRGKAFEVTSNSDEGKFKLEKSQYLKVYSEEESRKIKELIALKDRKRYFEYKLEKVSDNKLPHEDIMLQESDEIKNELKSLKDKYNQISDKRTSPAKKLKKTIQLLDNKLASIDNYAESLQKEKDKYTKFVENLGRLIEKQKEGQDVNFSEERQTLMDRIQAERGKYSTYIKELTDSDEAFKQNKALYYEVLKELREQFEDVINPDLLYESEYFAGVIDAMPEYGIDLRFRNRELSKHDFQEIVNFVIEGNGDTVESYNEDTQKLQEIKLDVKQLDGVGNQDYSDKIDRLDNIISNINTEATKALAKVRSTNRKQFSSEETINSYDFYNDIVNSIKRVERELSKDDSIFVPRTNLKISGYDDVFIGSDGNGIVLSDKKTAEQGLTTTSPNINENFAGFPSNSSNENDKHQWVYQKFLNDNDVTDYYVEYSIGDKIGTYTRDTRFDSDRTQKTIVAKIVKKDGTELKLNSWGQKDDNGAYLPITVLEAGSGKYRPENAKGVSPAKYRETEEADILREKLKTATDKVEIDSLTEQIAALDSIVESNLAKIQEERERILTVLESGKRFVSPIVGQSLGIKIPADDNEISKVLGNDYKEKIRDGKLKVVVVKDPEITIGNRKLTAKLGSVIIHETTGNNPRAYFLKGRKLDNQDFFKVAEEIKKFANNEVDKVFTSDFRGFYNKIRSYVYWGSNNDINKQYDGKTLDETINETEDSAKQKLYSLRFKFGSNSQIVEYGNYIGKDDKGKPLYENKEISVSEIEFNDDFREFITSKYKHFSSSLLSDYMVENIMTSTKSPLGVILDRNFTINLQPKSNVQFQSQYITPSNEQITKFEAVEKKEPKNITGSNSSDINFIEPSLRLSDALSYDEGLKQIEVWTNEGYLNKFQGFSLVDIYNNNVQSALEAQAKGESLASDKFARDILGIEDLVTKDGDDTTYSTKREFKSVAALNQFIQSLASRFPDIIGTKKVPTVNQAVETNTVEDIFGTESGPDEVSDNSASSLFGEDSSKEETIVIDKTSIKSDIRKSFYLTLPGIDSNGDVIFRDTPEDTYNNLKYTYYKFYIDPKSDGNIANFSFASENAYSVSNAIQFKDTYIDPAANLVKINPKSAYIKTLKEGKAIKKNGVWVVTEKAQLTTDDNDIEAYFMRYSKVLESQPKLRLQDLGINDFKSYFGVPFKVVDRLTKGVGFGVVRQAASDLSSIAYNIEVEENAPLGTEYHEKFHLFERAIFNDKERKQIYNLYRKTTKSTVTDAEASELLAEEFRYYSIERVAKDKRLKGTALEKVLAFIENFIKGVSELFSYKNSDTMNKLFDMMYNDTLKTATGKTIEQAISLKEVSTKLTSEEIRATQKYALLEYYRAFEKSVPNFNYVDFLINKDYSKKAKQTYARLNNFDIDNEVDGDSLVINHIIASMRIENPLLNAKFKDANNRKQFIQEFKAYYATINKESLITEELLEEEFNDENSVGGRGDAFETDPTSINHIQGTPSFVKQLLNTIPGDTNYLGLQEHVDSNNLNIELVYLFEKANSSVEMNNLLRESGRKEFLALADRLQSKSDLSSTDKNYRELRISKLNSFYTSLRKQILSFTQVDVEDEGKVTIIDKNRNTLIEKSLYDFKNNFKASFPAENEVELAKQLQGIESTTEYNFINKLGFTVDRRFINFLDDNNSLTKFNDTVSKIRQRDFKDKKAVEKLFKDPTKLTNIRIIAELISQYKSDIIPVQVLSTDNKPMYAIINRSFLSKKHNELVKKFKDAVVGTWESKIAKSKIIYNLGISSSEETQKSSKMTEKPSYIFHIANALDKEISPYINTGDKSSYFGFQGLASIVPGDVEITNEHYVEVFKEFFRQEFETFSKFKGADEGKVMPKMKSFFAITQDILPQYKLAELVFDKELKYRDFEALYESVKVDFEEGVRLEAQRANNKLKETLLDNGVITYDGKFNFIDSGSLNRRLITNPDQLVERLNLFFWESSMLQSKFIVGDIGIYGLDLAKRVPAGMATKTDGNYSPAVAKLLDTELKYSTNNILFNKTDKAGELIFDALVVDDLYHNDENLSKLFDNYNETNLSDAMAFEHIDSIRFREIAEGTWDDEDIRLYQLDLEGKANLEDLHKWTMKKTQYFGSQLVDFSKDSDDTMEINTFYKMAVLPISRTLINQSGSKTLRGIKKLMEDNNVPLVMFDSANKISRKQGYKLFDKDGNVNTSKESVNPYKQTSYWKYYNTQQETHKKSKSEQTLGTQFSKQIFANILEGDGNLTLESNSRNIVKSGVSDVFSDNKELSDIGTQEQYSQYLATIFPDSKVKDIVYHGNKEKNMQRWDKLPEQEYHDYTGNYYKRQGFYTSLNSTGLAKNYGGNLYAVLINARNPQPDLTGDMNGFMSGNVKQEYDSGFNKWIDGVTGKENFLQVVFEPEQIHILGNKEDIEGFKEFVKNNKTLTVKANDVINNIHNLHVERVDVTKKLLLERLGVTEAKGGYKVASKERLFKELKANLDQKDVSTVLKQEIEELLLNGRGLDITIGSGSFEAVLTSIVNKLIIQPKKFGSPMAQAANIGFTQMTNIRQVKDFENTKEFKDKNIVKLDSSMSNLKPLKFYQEGDDYMEVYLPNYFKTQVDINTIDKRLLDLIGFRIPTQSPNSIERIRVKGFLPESYGNMIIVPAQITTKAGSDFDIDKINLYFPNFTLEDGVPKYVESYNSSSEYKDNNDKLKAIDNGIHENYLTILDSKEYREQMLQPNSDERIKELCRTMKFANTEEGQTRLIDLLGINYHVANKQGSQLGKNVLGQAALHSTDHIMSQVADIYLRESRPNFEGIEKVQNDENTTTLATFRDIEGTRITDTISEMVNALVDVLKEPYIKYSGITEHNAATFFYMLRTGLTLKQVVHFFNHPLIRYYNKELAKRQFNSSVYNSTLHKNLIEEILGNFKNNQRTDENGNTIPNNQVIKITNTELEEMTSKQSASYNNFDYSVVKEFDRLFNAANKLNEFMRVSKFDTSGVGTSFGETRGMKFDFDKFEKNNDLGNGKSYIENWNNKFEKDGQKTTLGAYKDVVFESVDYFNSLYTANAYTNFKTSLDTLLAGILGKNRVSMYSKYVSDFATYVTQNYGSFPSHLIKKSKSNGTVAQRIKAVLKGDNKVLKNNLFLNKLILDTSGEQHKLLLQGGASMNVYEAEQLSTSFSELAYYDEHLANDIIKVGILQDGFSKSPYSFLQLIPIQYKLEQVQTYYSELAGVNIQDFDTKFKINNYKKALNQYYPPKGREFNQPDNTYTVGKKELNGKRKIYIKIAGKDYIITETGVVKDREEDVIIGRDSLDYRNSIIGKATEVNATSEEFKNSFISNAERVKIQNCK